MALALFDRGGVSGTMLLVPAGIDGRGGRAAGDAPRTPGIRGSVPKPYRGFVIG